MRLLYFITFFVAILFSEVVTHVVTWDESVYTELNTFIKSADVLVLPYTNSRLSQQSLKEIDIPPPDLI